MTLLALTHGYPPDWALGGEVSMHRMLKAVTTRPVAVLTDTPEPREFEGVPVHPLHIPNLLDPNADPALIAQHLQELGAEVVLAQNELSLPGVRAARLLGIPSIVSVHTPPRFGAGVKAALPLADHVIYNTQASAIEWGEPTAIVIHPPLDDAPLAEFAVPTGDAYTLLSSLTHKGVPVVFELADALPEQRFIVVESPAVSMELPDLRAQVARRPNVELHPRVSPEQVAERYLAQTRILLVPSRYETYGMSALEAASMGIPSVHVDTPHVREGIGEAAELIRPLHGQDALAAVQRIEAEYAERSRRAWGRAKLVRSRQQPELAVWDAFVEEVQVLTPAERAEREQRLSAPRRRGYVSTPRHEQLWQRRRELEIAREARREEYRAARQREKWQLEQQLKESKRRKGSDLDA